MDAFYDESHNSKSSEEVNIANTSTSVWMQVTVSAPGQSSQSGYQYLPKTREQFSYDDDGNLTSDGRWNYGWDAENRLVSLTNITSLGPQQVVRFEYDTKGRRVHKQVWGNNLGSGSPTNDVKFVYDGWNLLGVLNSSSALLQSFLWGLDLSGSPQGAGGVGGLLEVVYYGTQITNCFVAFDGNGNVAGLVNAADGGSIAQYEYGPFGELLRSTGPMAKADPFRFSTKYQDDEGDLIYYGYRYYSASTGRWLSRDPAEEGEGGPNLYGFVGSDPVQLIDPFGLEWKIMRFPGANKAPAWCACANDSFDDLAKLVGLDTSDYKKWAGTSDDKPVPNKIYLTPNTIYIEMGNMFRWYDGFGPIPSWRSWLVEAEDIWKGQGFHVVFTDPSDPDTARQHLKNDDIYGFAYAGHGGGNGATSEVVGLLVFADREGNTSLDGTRYTTFGIHYLFAFSCSSAKQVPNDDRMFRALGWRYSPWERNVATRGQFTGVWGEVQGYQTWSHLVRTSGSNR